MADYRENFERIVEVGWASGLQLKFWDFRFVAGFNDYRAGAALIYTAEELNDFNAEFLSGKTVLTGVDSGATFDFSLVPQLAVGETLSIFGSQPMANLPVYDETGTIITKADRPAFGSLKRIVNRYGILAGLAAYDRYDTSSTITFNFTGPVALEADFFVRVNNNFGTNDELHTYSASSDSGDTATTVATGLKNAINTGSVFTATSSGAVLTFEPASEEGGRFSNGLLGKSGNGDALMSTPVFNGTQTAAPPQPGFLWSDFSGVGGEFMKWTTAPT